MKRIDDATILTLGTLIIGFLFLSSFLSFWTLIHGKKNNFILLFVLLVMLGVFLYYYYKMIRYRKSASVVENDFPEAFYYLDEHGDLITSEPGALPVSLDGINTCKHPGKVFKAHNGVKLIIAGSGEVKEVNFLSRLYNRYGGGWMQKKDFTEEELQNQWEQLFDAC